MFAYMGLGMIQFPTHVIGDAVKISSYRFVVVVVMGLDLFQ